MLRGQIAIARPTGRLPPEAIRLFEATGIGGLEGLMESRRLLCEDVTGAYRFMVLRPADIPTYVEHGATDIGVVGKDILLEQERDVYEPLDLKFGACRLGGWPPSIPNWPNGTSPSRGCRSRSSVSRAPSSWRRSWGCPSGSWIWSTRAGPCRRTIWKKWKRSPPPPRGSLSIGLP